ncbi:UNVERIFIED_CONTAM: hypothetical protein DVV43_12105, partial [Lactobacillus helveticus]|nr:hypothetical protein [Lactobacillus helveticus]
GGHPGADTGQPVSSRERHRVPGCRLLREGPVRTAVGLVVARFEDIGPPARSVLVGLLGRDAGAAQVPVDERGGDSIAENGVGGGDSDPHVAAGMLGRVADGLGTDLRLHDGRYRHRVPGHLVEVPVELGGVHPGQRDQPDAHVAACGPKLGD